LQGVFAPGSESGAGSAVGIDVFHIFPPWNGRRFNFYHNVIFALPTPGQDSFLSLIPTAEPAPDSDPGAKTPCNACPELCRRGLLYYTRFAGFKNKNHGYQLDPSQNLFSQ